MSRPLNIGEAAEAAGVSPKMIRHYEQIGLVPEPPRTEGGYRQYGEREVSVLRFIRQSRRLGFSMDQIAELLGLWSNRHRTSREVKAVAQQHLDALAARMREMAEMQQALQQLVSACHGDDTPDCAILDELALHSPAAPEPGEQGAAPVRPAARRSKAHATGQAGAGADSAAHLGLMAWTRALHHRP